MNRTLTIATAGLALLGALGSAIPAQAGDSDFYSNTPYGYEPGEENAPVHPSFRDQNGNRTMVMNYADGMSASSPTYSYNSGVQSVSTGGSYSGEGYYGQATAIGNNLTVITTGSYNTVFVNATQVNNGNQEANVVLNGGIDAQ
jgi:holdfast attachment protein HfaA